MTIALVLIPIAVLIVFVYAVTRHRTQISSMADFQARWRKVDIEAFANLVDPAEEDYLRRRLEPHIFRTLQRDRLRAAWEYLGRVSENAQLMIQAGQIIERHNTGAEADRARRHVDAAIELRNAVFIARLALGLRIFVPVFGARLEPVLRLYGNAAHSFDNVLDPAVATVRM